MPPSVIYEQHVDGSSFSVTDVTIDALSLWALAALARPPRSGESRSSALARAVPIPGDPDWRGAVVHHIKRDGRDSTFGRPGHDEPNDLDDAFVIDDHFAKDALA